ncbi:AMP-binding enzyme [Nonomuraea rubra]|uniref:AMP-binding enzyme n=1 Tax=Nonomuraea rubra TaxID=46180 RepID=UPI0031F02711
MIAQRIRVVADDGRDVPADAATVGEIAVRGNDVMIGYHRDPAATGKAAPDGWFRTGDLGVVHADGYVQIVDRAKDVIISGGENIASVEVENVLLSHPGVLEAAVVARPDAHWGEVPVAYVTLATGARATEAELIEHVRARLAHFKAPKAVIFGELPQDLHRQDPKERPQAARRRLTAVQRGRSHPRSGHRQWGRHGHFAQRLPAQAGGADRHGARGRAVQVARAVAAHRHRRGRHHRRGHLRPGRRGRPRERGARPWSCRSSSRASPAPPPRSPTPSSPA